jgi:glycopeptide antibiotics resistance protein
MMKKAHSAIGAAFALYLIVLLAIVFFPRPILKTGDSTMQSNHFFYKILYADSKQVGLANFFMLTPFPILLRAFTHRTRSASCQYARET